MSTKSTLLISNYSNSNSPASWYFTEKKQGSGYHNKSNCLHTAVFVFDNFKGSVKLQATLELQPGDADWFDVVYDNSAVQLTSLDSTPIVDAATRNFTGNFLWVRAGVMLEEGTISEIRYNY